MSGEPGLPATVAHDVGAGFGGWWRGLSDAVDPPAPKPGEPPPPTPGKVLSLEEMMKAKQGEIDAEVERQKAGAGP